MAQPRITGVLPQTTANWYDITNRTTVRDNWNLVFAPTAIVQTGWTGDVAAGIPGTTTQAWKDAVAARINWYRAMAGVPVGITIDATFSAKDQQAALMFSANRQLSHNPPSNWIDYTADAATAAANSNICLGYSMDPGCITTYIYDFGANNSEAGHRRWILYPQTQTMGTGDVPQSGPVNNPYLPANALWVFDGNFGAPRPATRGTYVAWPPPGFVPYQTVAPRWSFSYPNADFSNATVSMQRNGSAVPVRLEAVQNGFGENTIVWVPDNLDANSFPQLLPPASDTTSTVTINNVVYAGSAHQFQYSVTVFDPSTDPGASFQFSPASTNISSGSATGFANLVVIPSTAAWYASSSATWLHITSPVAGTGSTSIAWSADANTSSFNRAATITAAGATFTVNQSGAACTYTPNQPSGTLPAAGGSGSFVITASPSDCAFGPYNWSGPINVTNLYSPPKLTLNYSAGANNTGSTLNSTINVVGLSLKVSQRAVGAMTLKFLTVTPCRIADTRNTTGPFGGPAVAGETARDFIIPSSACGIPSNAAAYSINVTVVPRGTLGYLTVYPTGQSLPLASTLNSLDGRVKANAATVPAGINGGISIFATDTTDVILDINGYFVLAGDGVDLTFFPLTPCRVADTRNANGPLGGPFVSGGHPRTFPVMSSACGAPATAQAYSLNFTAVPRGTLGYLSTYPTGFATPLVSTLNAIGGQVTANAAIVPVGTGGSIDAFATDDTDLVIDINGYFASSATGGLSLYTLTPCRVVDTRIPAGSQPFSGTRTISVSGSPCAVPGATQAYVLSATVVPAGLLGYLSLWPQGQSQPLVSTLNSLDGAVTSNMALVPTANGSVSVFNSDPAHVVLDVTAYFAP